MAFILKLVKARVGGKKLKIFRIFIIIELMKNFELHTVIVLFCFSDIFLSVANYDF